MTRLLLSAATLAAVALAQPAAAQKLGIFLDGASAAISYTDPYNEPPFDPVIGGTNARWGMLHFRFSSLGQVSDGDVQVIQVMWPGNNYDGPIQVRLVPPNNGNYTGEECPYLYWDMVNHMGNNDDGSLDDIQQAIYAAQQCGSRPDPRFFSSGSNTGIELILKDQNGNWLYAIWEGLGNLTTSGGAAPAFDGGQYDVQIYYSTGDLHGGPWAVATVSERGGATGVITWPDNADASYFYNTIPDGFDVPWAGNFWQVGTLSTDINYRMYFGFTGALGEVYEMFGTSFAEIDPLPSRMGTFVVAGTNAAADIGAYGQVPVTIPPVVYLSGGAADFLVDQADIGYGVADPQEYISQGWTMSDPYNNPNFAPTNGAGVVDGLDF